jgi:hypothetical protein
MSRSIFRPGSKSWSGGDQAVTLKFGPNLVANILGIVQLSQEAFEFEEFSVGFVVKPGFYGDTIVDLVTKGVRRIVHQDRLGEVTP